jgi:hypothetical protein
MVTSAIFIVKELHCLLFPRPEVRYIYITAVELA